MIARTPLVIRRFSTLPDPGKYLAGIDTVFYRSSNTQTFADAATQAAFRERWLGRYLAHDAEWAFLALTDDDDVAGYIVGCLSDPAQTARFADIPYFKDLAAQTRLFPAHLHVNLLEPYRNAGMGSRLIETFVSEARKAGTPGVHVVTGRGARNVAFYRKNGFSEVATWGTSPNDVVFLGRKL